MIFRVEKNKNYTTMSNYHLRDKNISLKAKGLLSWMLSNDDDWDYSLAGIVACCKEGETSVTTALKELQEHGYVHITKQNPDNTNNRIHYIYDVYEKPQGPGFLGLENQVLESQVLENPGQINTNIRNTNIINTKKEKVLISKDISTRENFLGSSSKKQSNNSLYSKCIAMLDDFVVTHNLDNEVRKQLIEYLNFRLQVKDKPLYANMWKGMLNKLATLCSEGHNVYDIIQFCIERGYLSFYPPSDNTNSKVRLCDRDVITTEPTEQDRKWLREMKEKGELF